MKTKGGAIPRNKGGIILNQTSLDIPQIDEEKTRFKMEKMMEKYKMLRLQTPEDFLPKITTTYTITPPSFSNQFHSSTEEAVLKKWIGRLSEKNT